MRNDRNKKIAVFLAPRGGDRRGAAPELMARLLAEGCELLCLITTKPPLPEHPKLKHLQLDVPGRKRNSFFGLLYLSVAGPFIFLGAALKMRPGRVLVFHTHAALLSKLAALVSWAPVVLFVDIMPWQVEKRSRRFILPRALLYLRDCLGFFCANRIVCSSANAANELVTAFPLLESRVRLLAHSARYPFPTDKGVAEPQQVAAWREGFPRRRQEFLRSHQAHDKTFVIATVDELQALKNLEYLFRAVAAMEDDRVLILVYGEGPQKMSLLSLIISLGLVDQVHLLGRSDDFFDLLGAVDLIVVPRGARGSSSLRELLGSGAPIIAADSPQSREVLQHNDLLFEPDNVQALVAALKEAKSSKEHLRQLREMTRERARHFTYDWAGKAIELILEDLG